MVVEDEDLKVEGIRKASCIPISWSRHTLRGELEVAEAVAPPPPLLKNENYQPIDVWKHTALYHIALPRQ